MHRKPDPAPPAPALAPALAPAPSPAQDALQASAEAQPGPSGAEDERRNSLKRRVSFGEVSAIPDSVQADDDDSFTAPGGQHHHDEQLESEALTATC